jgi:hypothetical protein
MCPCEPLGGVAFQDHPAPGCRLSHDQHPREHLDVLVRQQYGGALGRLAESDGRACSRPHFFGQVDLLRTAPQLGRHSGPRRPAPLGRCRVEVVVGASLMRHPPQGCRGGAGRAARRLARHWPQVPHEQSPAQLALSSCDRLRMLVREVPTP